MLEYLKTLLACYLPKTEKGQDLTEYGLLVALIAIVVVVAVLFFGTTVSAFFQRIGDTIATW